MPASSMRRIAMPDEGIETLFGSFDENLRHLESALDVTLKTSGHDVVVEGRRRRAWRAPSVCSSSWPACCGADTGSRAAT